MDMELEEPQCPGRSKASGEEETTEDHDEAEGGPEGGGDEGLTGPAQPEAGAAAMDEAALQTKEESHVQHSATGQAMLPPAPSATGQDERSRPPWSWDDGSWDDREPRTSHLVSKTARFVGVQNQHHQHSIPSVA